MNTSTEPSEHEPAATVAGWSPGELHETLRRRRTAVLKHIDQNPKSDVLSELVFDLLVHLALNPDSELDEKLVESFAWRHELDSADAQIRLLDGTRKSLPELLEVAQVQTVLLRVFDHLRRCACANVKHSQ